MDEAMRLQFWVVFILEGSLYLLTNQTCTFNLLMSSLSALIYGYKYCQKYSYNGLTSTMNLQVGNPKPLKAPISPKSPKPPAPKVPSSREPHGAPLGPRSIAEPPWLPLKCLGPRV